MKAKSSRLFAAIIVILIVLAVISIAIACPILIRPFYYAHIDALSLPESTGFSREVIVEAYDEMLDFCVLWKPFGTGKLAWSEEGRMHFEDCAKLFRLDFAIAAISVVGLALCFAISRMFGILPHRPSGMSPAFRAGRMLISGAVVSGLAAVFNFDEAFNLFHKVLFPGKTNYVFDKTSDQIILILPPRFFANCALLIVGIILLAGAVMIISGWKTRDSRAAEKVGPRI